MPEETLRECFEIDFGRIEIAAIQGKTDLRRFEINRRRPISPCVGAVSNRRWESQDTL